MSQTTSSFPHRVTRRMLLVGVGAAVFVAAGVFWYGSWVETGRVRAAVVHVDMSQSEVEHVIAAMTPIGSAASEVLRVCSDAGLEHSEFVERDRAVYAMVRDPRQSLLRTVRKEYQLIFAFDTESKLSEVKCKPVFTGP